jgi:hypothetical protein
MTPDPSTQGTPPHLVTQTEQAVLDAIRATPYGSVEVVLHQGRIVQVVRTQNLKVDAST